MPGRGSYGAGGKWIHDRAHRIMAESEGTPKSVAYAIATQQAHKVGKSPKRFRTAEGVRTALAKMTKSPKEYRKTAMIRGLFDELEKISQTPAAPTAPGGLPAPGMGAASPGAVGAPGSAAAGGGVAAVPPPSVQSSMGGGAKAVGAPSMGTPTAGMGT